MNEKEPYSVEGPCCDPTVELQMENDELKAVNKKLTEDLEMFKRLYNEYLDKTVKYRGACQVLIEELKR